MVFQAKLGGQKGADWPVQVPKRTCGWAGNGFTDIDQKCALTPNPEKNVL
jgi:hypothetical protein